MEPPRVLVLGRALLAPGEHQPQDRTGVEHAASIAQDAHAPGAAMDASSTWRESVVHPTPSSSASGSVRRPCNSQCLGKCAVPSWRML